MRYFFLGILLMGVVDVSAQSAIDYYHNAAGLYINGEVTAAEQAAEAGLAIDPNDARLQALLERIRQQQEQQNQQQQSNEGDQSDSLPHDNGEQQDEQNNQENDGESEQQDSEPQNDGQGEQDQPRDDGSAESDRQEEHQPEPEQADQQNQDGREGEQQELGPQSNEGEAGAEDTQPVQLGRMSRAEAERILGALRADESTLLRSIQRRPANPRRVERDW